MTRYLLDTNLLLLQLRQDRRCFTVQNRFNLNRFANVISVVSLGELRSLAIRNQWGELRMSDLYTIEKRLLTMDIHAESVIHRYGEIDAYSQGKLIVKVNYPIDLCLIQPETWVKTIYG